MALLMSDNDLYYKNEQVDSVVLYIPTMGKVITDLHCQTSVKPSLIIFAIFLLLAHNCDTKKDQKCHTNYYKHCKKRHKAFLKHITIEIIFLTSKHLFFPPVSYLQMTVYHYYSKEQENKASGSQTILYFFLKYLNVHKISFCI